jgi:hypothetical protein
MIFIVDSLFAHRPSACRGYRPAPDKPKLAGRWSKNAGFYRVSRLPIKVRLSALRSA